MMIRHHLTNGEIRKNLTGITVTRESVPEVYELMEQMNKKRKGKGKK